MSNRVIRDGILTSEAVNKLKFCEELFFRKLLSVVDDYGRYEARPAILRAMLYPAKIDQVTPEDIERWLEACVQAGLVRTYKADGRTYLEVLKFNQKLRRLIPKWPPPPDVAPLAMPAKTGSRSGESVRSAKSDG